MLPRDSADALRDLGKRFSVNLENTPSGATAPVLCSRSEVRHKLRANDIPPDLRAPWLTIEPDRTYRRFSSGTVGWLTLTRRWNSSDSQVTVTTGEGVSVPQFLGAALEELAQSCRTDLMACPALGTAVLLSLWDAEFRRAELIDGNVYLASHASIPALAAVAGWSVPLLQDPGTCERLLHELTDAELLYQFPVAAKFCGGYRPERQLRLNGFGRRLAAALQHTNAAAQSAARDRIRGHLSVHHDQYAQHMHLLTELDTTAVGTAWESAQALPVGVLS